MTNDQTLRHRIALAVGLVLLVSFLTWLARYPDPWVAMTLPFDGWHDSMPVLGYVGIRDGTIVHLENTSSFFQISMLNEGNSSYVDMYFLRIIYGFVGAIFHPFIGYRSALLFTNVLLWSSAVLLAVKMTREIGGDRLASGVVAALVLTGSGWVIHSNDLSAHTLSFVVYSVSFLALWKSRIWDQQHPLRTHLQVGFLMGLGLLAYNTTLYALVIYALLSLRRNRWHHVGIAFLIAMMTSSLWNVFLVLGDYGATLLKTPTKAGTFLSHYANRSLRNIEGRYLAQSIASWKGLVASGPWAFLSAFLRYLSQFATLEFPLTSVGGVLSGLFLWRRGVARQFILLAVFFFLLPVAGAMVWTPSASARGYLIYCGFMPFQALLAVAFSTLYRDENRVLRVASVLGFAAILVGQTCWSFAHLAGNFGPLKTYFLGVDVVGGLFLDPPQFLSLTGEEPTPVAFGGKGSLAEAGLLSVPGAAVMDASLTKRLTGLVLAIISRGYIGVLCLAVVALMGQGKRKRIAFFGVLAVLLGPPLVVAAAPRRTTLKFHSDPIWPVPALKLAPGEQLTMTVELGAKFREKSSILASKSTDFVVYSPRAKGVSLHLGGDLDFDCKGPQCHLPRETFLSLLDGKSKRLVVTMKPLEETPQLSCWQSSHLPGRTLAFEPPRPLPPCLPALEIRLKGQHKTPLLLGF